VKKRIGVLLSGCGVFDGAEIHESTLTLYFLDREGSEAVCFAPDIEQHHVINHLTSEETLEKRRILTEAARITRGKITSLTEISEDELDGLILPGGVGAAKNLIDYALKGRECMIHSDVKRIILGRCERRLLDAIEAKRRPVAFGR